MWPRRTATSASSGLSPRRAASPAPTPSRTWSARSAPRRSAHSSPSPRSGREAPPPPDGYFAAASARSAIATTSCSSPTRWSRASAAPAPCSGTSSGRLPADIVTLAKGLTSGYQPLGASVVADHVWNTIAERLPKHVPVSHGFTYSGHPAVCAAAMAVSTSSCHGLVTQANEVGAYPQERLRARLGDHESVGEIRGLGLMAGIERG